MLRLFRAFVSGLTAMAGGIVCAAPVLAADEASPAPTPASTGAIVALGADALAVVLIVLIAAAVISLAMVLWFNRDALQQYYAAAVELGAKGIIATSELVPGMEAQAGLQAPLDGAEAPEPLIVEGPTVAEVGTAAEFKASREVTWAVAPAAAAAVLPTHGATTKVTPATTGVIAVSATDNGAVAERQLAVMSRKQEIKLPFVGRGYGTIAIGVLSVFAVLALGLSGRLGGEAIATFFGGLLGVGAARVASGAGGKAGGAAESDD